MCGESGHFCRDCPRNQQKSKPKHKAKLESVGSHFDPECDADEGAFGASQSFDTEGWIVDSGASSHMTPVREILVDYIEFEMVYLGDGQTVEAFGRGNVHLTMFFTLSNPKKVTMHDALYVVHLKYNLLSVKAAAA